MGRHSTYPMTIEDCLTISITRLKKWKYLELNQNFTATLNWSRNNKVFASISIQVNTIDIPYIILDYKTNDEPINYKVYLTQIPSNLDNGYLWYFVCPFTGKQCRKLYKVDKYFLHRDYHKLPYSKQIQSKKTRDMEKTFGAYFDLDNVYEQLYTKHLKKHYKGKPTKKYAKLSYQIRKAENISPYEIERLLMS